MRIIPVLFIIPVSMALLGCPVYNCTTDTLKLPETPFNLVALNSPYDDWNCGIPWEEYTPGMEFLFSSNRNTKGGTFDLTPHNLVIQGENNFRTSNDSAWYGTALMMYSVAKRVNTSLDELGPTFISLHPIAYYGAWQGALVYSQGTGSDHDLHVLSSQDSTFEFMVNDTTISDQVNDRELSSLNTSADEGYFAYSDSTRRILFHSNRDGKYHIYQATLPDSMTILQWLASNDSNIQVSRAEVLVGSDGEERCPSLHGDTLLFVSDRSGGQGGFDIYRSIWNGTTWSSPKNLGSKVNSSSNEYRPVILSFARGPGILFSSDRAGGLGGYDLYMVKAP